jgi:ribosomal protein S9
MAKQTRSYEDAKGKLHKKPDDATRADLAAVIGGGASNTDDSIAPGIAATIFQRRADIERIFREHDEMTAPECTVAGYPPAAKE